jgi:hypothetical protein
MHIIFASMLAKRAETAALRFIRREIRRGRPVPQSAIRAFLARHYPDVAPETTVTRLLQRFH